MASKELHPFTCTRCGLNFMLTNVSRRKYCPDCAKIVAREQAKISNQGKKQREKEQRKATALYKAKAATLYPRDAEIDARSRKQMEQCDGCEFQGVGSGCKYCDYRSWFNIGPQRGKNPGECMSFVPKGTMSRHEKLSRVRRQMIFSEADHSFNA